MAVLTGYEKMVAEIQTLLLTFAAVPPLQGVFGPEEQWLPMPGLGTLRLRYYRRPERKGRSIRVSGEPAPTSAKGPPGWSDLVQAIVTHPDDQVLVPGLGLWQKSEDYFMVSPVLSAQLNPAEWTYAPDDGDWRARAGRGQDELHALSSVEIALSDRGLELLREFYHEDQLALRAVTWLVAEVHNGGFRQYFQNSTGNIQPWILRGLQKIGDQTSLDLLREATAAYFGDDYPLDRSRRQDLSGDASSEIEERVQAITHRYYDHLETGATMRLLKAYIAAHPAHFYR